MRDGPQYTRLLSIKEVAQLLHVSDRTVKRRIAEGELAGHKVGHQWRLAKTDVEDYLRRRRFRDAPDVL